MQSPSEKFSTNAHEVSYLAAESQKAHILSHEQYPSPESAVVGTIEQYARAEAADFLHQTRVLPAHEAERIALRLKPEDHDKQMEELFGVMLERGIKNALDVVQKMNNPHLVDDFHRFLVQYLHTIGSIPGLAQKSELAHELNHALFTVTLPPTQSDNSATFKSFIQAMKQLYIGMAGVSEAHHGDHYSLELAVSNHGRDIAVYASIPRSHVDTFEKLVHAYYPGAAIEEAIDDYNIFSGSATGIAGAVATLAEPAVFPIMTDASFEHDPLAALIGSLSKLEQSGEGAAIQLVVSGDTEGTNRVVTSLIERAQKDGSSIKDLYKEATESIGATLGKGFLSLFASEKKPDETTEVALDTRGIELAKTKNATVIVSASIRIIASAPSLARAQSILATIKSSFNQFTAIDSNGITWRDVSARDIPELARDFSFRTIRHKDQLPLNVDELATLFHFPVGLQSTPELKEATATQAPAPAALSNSGVYLGTNTYRGTTTDIWLDAEDRVRHTYVIGQTGTGKTTILKNMAIQDIKNGNGICFIDPHGSDLQDILANIPPERLDDVIYFDPAYAARPMGLNMLEYDVNYPEQKIFVINELLAIFNKLFDMKVAGGPMFEQYFRNSAMLVMDDPESGSTLLEIGRVLSDKAFRQLKLSRCKNPIVKQFWENAEKTTGESSLANFVPYITNKFDVFISNDVMRPVIAQQKSVLNFREIMDGKKILLVNLSKGRLGDINSHLIGLVLVGKLTMAALSRVDILGRSQVNDFYLYIDEFQNVTTDSIATILSEARKYRLALTVAHQYIEQLDPKIKDAVFGNVGNMIIYRVSPENANMFEQQLAPTFSPADILKLENFNAYAKILVRGMPEKPFNLRIPPPPRGNLDVADKIKELSYLTYGRPRADVEAEIMARYNPLS